MKAQLKIGVAVVVVAALGFVAGCGGDDSNSVAEPSGTEASGGETAGGGDAGSGGSAFVRKANAGCMQAREDAFPRVAAARTALSKEGLKGEELTEKAIGTGLIETVEAEIEGIEQLEPPAGDEEEVEAIVASLQKTLAGAKAWAKSSGPEDRTEGNTLATEITLRFQEVDPQLYGYGLDSCAKGGAE